MECSRRSKVHSLIDKVYDPANLAEAWKRVRENKGSAGIDGLTVGSLSATLAGAGSRTGFGEGPGSAGSVPGRGFGASAGKDMIVSCSAIFCPC